MLWSWKSFHEQLKVSSLLCDLQGDWLEAVAPHIQARIARYSANEIRFNLMAVVADRQEQLSKQLAAAQARRQAAAAKLGLSDGGGAAAMETDGPASSSAQQPLPDSEADLQQVLAEAEGNIVRCVGMVLHRHLTQCCSRCTGCIGLQHQGSREAWVGMAAAGAGPH